MTNTYPFIFVPILD